ncbi:MAG: AMP-binding protein [Marmoricola sp.]
MTDAPAPQYLDDRLNYWAQVTPDVECMSYLERSWTFGQWHERVRRCAGALRQAGVGRGDVIAFLDKNHPACVEMTIAAAMLGAANAVINFRLAGAEIDYAINDSGAKLLVVGSELLPTIDQIKDQLPGVQTIWEVTPDGAEGDEYEQALGQAEQIDRDPAVTPDDVVLVMYSSGTTGRPKGVMITQRALIAHTQRP